MDTVVIVLAKRQLEYLKFVMASHIKNGGMEVDELADAAAVWYRLCNPAPLGETPETVQIEGPVSLEIDGDVRA